jgi:hypothetical protein
LALKASWIIVIDVDCKFGKSSQKTFDELDVEYGFPKTETVRSPSGGLHYYYEGEHTFALGTNGFGLDIDSPNYVLIVGCELIDPITGYITYYKAVGDTPTATAPEWFSKFLVKREANKNVDTATPLIELDQDDNVSRMREWLKEAAPPAIEGRNGDHTTLKVAMRLRDEGISQSKAVELMAEHYNIIGTCDPEWSPEELEKKVENAFAYASINAPGEKTAEAEFTQTIKESPMG